MFVFNQYSFKEARKCAQDVSKRMFVGLCSIQMCPRRISTTLKSESMNSNNLSGLYATFGDSPEKEIYRHFETRTGIAMYLSLYRE
jgi:hypothetical protein